MIAGGKHDPRWEAVIAVPGDSPTLLLSTLGPVLVTVWSPSTE